MTRFGPESFAMLGPLLDQALDLPEAERSEWLAALRRGRPAVAVELERLLSGETELEARRFLAGSPGVTLLEAAAPAGARVGPYVLVRPLGRGGMGSVWLGRRVDGRYDAEVAVKLLSYALPSQAGAERFRREGSTLARLTHPNIGRLIDAGISGSGHAYLVLEYVDGTRLDLFCDEQRLTPQARLSLFLQLLAAVAHAHANLIVHRDIKPSNVLVTRSGQVKLLDFGIAKLLEGPGSEELTALTREGGLPFTPEYAAPEQVTGGPITTATDVYALGVVLYRLLAGRHPTGPGLETTAQHLRATLEVEPPRLSSQVTDAAQRGSTPERLRRLYAGDLDNILAKALQKDPARRYPSVTEFAEDIERHLRHEPVLARNAPLAYRMRKFVRRHRTAAAAGAVVMAALLAATVVTSSQMLEAQRQRDEARQQRDRALYQEERAAASSGFMDYLLENISTSGKTYTTTGLLDQARALLEEDYREDPRFVARMMVDLSVHYYRLRERSRQYGLLERADQLARRVGDPETVAHANCWLGMTRAFDGDVAMARQHIEQAERALAQVVVPPLAVQIRCLHARSNLARRTGQVDSALGYARAAVRLSEAAGDSGSYRHQAVLNELSGALGTAGRFREALAANRRSIALLERTGHGSTGTMTVELYNEAVFLNALGEKAEADARLARAIRLAAAMEVDGRVPTYMASLAGELAGELGRPDSAVASLQRARSIARGHRDRAGEAQALGNLVEVLIAQGRLAEARRHEDALRALLPGSRRDALTVLDARLALAQGEWGEGSALLAGYLARPGNPRRNAPLHLPGLITLAADAALHDGRPAVADSLAAEGLRVAARQGHDASRSAVVGDALVVRARARLAQGDVAAARALLASALAPLASGYGPDHARVRESRALADSLGARVAGRTAAGASVVRSP